VQPPSGAHEPALLGDRDEVSEVAQLHTGSRAAAERAEVRSRPRAPRLGAQGMTSNTSKSLPPILASGYASMWPGNLPVTDTTST
jgi:hypothetical protein